MFSNGQKIFGYAFEKGLWLEFSSWDLMEMSEVDYRKWHDRYEKRIHINRNNNSPLVHFNRGHKTFSYYSKQDKANSGSSGPITLSHLLRQKVLSELTEANFSFSKNKINKNDLKKYKETITFKSIILEEEVTLPNGNKRRPDAIISFEEPAELALKWNKRIFVEVVEENETSGEKIEAYEGLNIAVIEIPPSSHFNDLKRKKFSDITKKEVFDLEKKIRNYFKKSIWSDIIIDPISTDYLTHKADSKTQAENTEVSKNIESEKLKNERLQNKIKELEKRLNETLITSEQLSKENRKLNIQNENYNTENRQLISKIKNWNEKSIVSKLTLGLKLK